MKIRNTIKPVLLILFISIGLLFCIKHFTYITINEEELKQRCSFQSMKDEDFDVLFFGTSHTKNSVIPMELWKEYGITSYNFASYSVRIPEYFWLLKYVLQTSHPKIVAIEILNFDKEKTNFKSSHHLFNLLPFSKLKFDAAVDLFDNDLLQITEAMFPFIRYHNRWGKLEKKDFVLDNTPLLGFTPLYRIMVENLPQQMIENPIPVENVGTEYLLKTIQLCKDEGIDVFLYSMPTTATEEVLNSFGYAKQISHEQDINYLSPDLILEAINPKTDYFDHWGQNSHLNFGGALKLTEFMGKYISDTYHISGRADHSEKQSAAWDQYYSEYLDFKEKEFQTLNDIEAYSVKCSDPDFYYIVEINNADIIKSGLHADILENMGIDISAINKDSGNLFILRNKEMVLSVQNYLSGTDFFIDTPIGLLSFIQVDEGLNYQMLLNNQIVYKASFSDLYQADLRITVIEKESNKFVDTIFWNVPGDLLFETGKRK